MSVEYPTYGGEEKVQAVVIRGRIWRSPESTQLPGGPVGVSLDSDALAIPSLLR